MIYIYTSSAFNYIPKVKLLMDSVKVFFPEATRVLSLADKHDTNVELEKYGIDMAYTMEDFRDEIVGYDSWVFKHSIVELCTAIKPYVLEKLLQREDCEAVLYFDPDMVIFSDMSELIKEFDSSSILLTPHVTEPEVKDELVWDNEVCALRHGTYNFGFYGVKKSTVGLSYAQWWRKRVTLACYDDICNGVFTDQKWNDLVPGLFSEVKVLRSSRYNVATWNTSRRKLSGDWEKGFLVDGEPLGFYHFTGFDSGDHSIMLEKNSSSPKVQKKLTDWYLDQITKIAKDPLCQVQWFYGRFSNGDNIEKLMRIAYRERVELQASFKNPFDCDSSKTYIAWWKVNAEKEGLTIVNELNRVKSELLEIKLSRIWRSLMKVKKLYRKVF